MANSFKTFLPEDMANTRTLLHESIPITGTISSGTYANDSNIKTFSHGMYEAVYDYPYLSSSANHIFDITMGYSSGSLLNNELNTQNTKKVNIYNQMALVLNTTDITGRIKPFDRDGQEDVDDADDMTSVYFLSFARLLNKDEIKKDSFRLSMWLSSTLRSDDTGEFPFVDAGELSASARSGYATVGDYNAQTNYRTNSPAGEYGLLYTGSDATGLPGNLSIGHIYYQAGIAVLTSSIFEGAWGPWESDMVNSSLTQSVVCMLTGATINQNANGFRFTLDNLSFNNTTELNSTIYFCRAHNTEFNYSANSTYISASQILVKGNNPAADPVAYITTVGLYSPDNELLAVAKVSEPLKKSPSNELTLRVRLDY